MQFVDRCVMLTIVVVLSSKYYYTALSLSLLCWKEKIFFRCSRFTHSTFLCSNKVFLHGCTSTHCVREAISRFNSMNHPTHLYIKLYHEMNIMNKYCHTIGCAICVKMLKVHDFQWNTHCLTIVNTEINKILKKNCC